MIMLLIDLDIGNLLMQQVAVIPALIAAGGALAGGLLNNFMNRDSMDYKSALSKDLMDYEWKNYKSPLALRNAYAAAGISPAVAMGNQGVGGNVATPSPIMPTDSPYLIGGIDSFANAVKSIAEAKKVGADTVGKTLENDLLKATFDEQVRKVGLENNWTQEQTSKTVQEVGLLCGQFNEIQQKIENMRSEKALTDKNVEWFNRHMKAEILHLKESANYQKAMAGLTDSQKELFDSTMDDMKELTSLNTQQMQKVVELLGKFGSAQAVVGMISQLVGSASDLIEAIAGFKKPSQVTKIIGP